MNETEVEIKLLETYRQEIEDMIGQSTESLRSASSEAEMKRKFRERMQQRQHKLGIYEKQLVRVKAMSPNNTQLNYYEAALYDFRARLKVKSSVYAKYFGGLFASEFGDLREAVKLYDQALRIYEYPNGRLAKVDCYITLSDKQSALQELDYILKHYADNEDVYLEARKIKDELENPPTSGIGQFFRSIFG